METLSSTNNAIKEYRLAKGWRIFIYIGAPLMLILFLGIIIGPFIPSWNNGNPWRAYWFLLPLSLGMIVVIILGLLDAIKGKFVIEKDRIYSTSSLRNRILMLDEIKGYTINDKYIIIESNTPEKKNIKLSTYIGKKHEIMEWLESRYNDLDIVNMHEEKEAILNSETFGATEEHRQQRLKNAVTISKILNWSGGLILVWAIFRPAPYEYAILACMVLPLLCLIAVRYYKGLIRVDERKNSAYPSALTGLSLAVIALLLRTIFDYEIFDYANIWMPAIVIAFVYTGILVTGSKEVKQKGGYAMIIFLLVLMFGYGYGAIVQTNCLYDKSVPENYRAAVLKKWINKGKTNTYHLELSRWGSQKEADDVQVKADLYNRVSVDDSVNIYFMKGYLHVPWFEVTE